ncbi:MAG TPA: cytochrome c [Saprospiraceae bacterium]|nr:cytochrome c [Saprospiraceae bacterium]
MVVLACGTSLYLPTAETASADELPTLLQGRKLYISHCSSCHNLYPVNHFGPDRWVLQVEEMKTRAKISDEQAALITKYLASYTSK